MNIFHFENDIEKKYIKGDLYNQVNLISKDNEGRYYVTGIKRRMRLSDVRNGRIVTYKTIANLKRYSQTYCKHSGIATLLVTEKGTDCANWETKEIAI